MLSINIQFGSHHLDYQLVDEENPPLVTAALVSESESLHVETDTDKEAGHDSKLTAVPSDSVDNIIYLASHPLDKSIILPVSSSRVPATIPICPHCHTADIKTRIRTYPSIETVALTILLFWLNILSLMQGSPIPFFLIPLVNDSFKTTDHYCTHCNEMVVKVKPFRDWGVKEMG